MIEPIGVATILIGLVCLRLGDRAMATAMIIASVFGASAAAFVGAANIQPAHMLLVFAVLSTFTRRKETVGVFRAFKPGEPGFWFLCLVVYGCVSAYFLPRIFAGQTYIIPLGTSAEYAYTGSTVPLGPVSSNFTQSAYMVANLIAFGIVASMASKPDGFEVATKALLIMCAANVALALLDLATYATGTGALLDFMRNAKYTMHDEEEIAGLKRIVGSFPEASAFARFTLGMLGFAGTLMLCGFRTKWTAPLTVASLLLSVFSTSSSGLAALPPVCCILYLTALLHCGTGARSRYSSLIVIFVPQLVLAATLYVLSNPALSATILHYVDVVVLSKGSTSSAIDRNSWNTLAQQNLMDSYGIGVGLGTIRTSSFIHALVAGVGVFGTVLYALFLGSMFLKRSGLPRNDYSDVRLACRNGCLGFILGDVLIASTIDQGLMFSAFAAVASVLPERAGETTKRAARPTTEMRQAW